MKLKEGYAVRTVLGEDMLMPIDHYSQGKEIYALNDVAAFILKKISKSISKDELIDEILKEYDVDKNSAEDAVGKLLAPFYKLGYIED